MRNTNTEATNLNARPAAPAWRRAAERGRSRLKRLFIRRGFKIYPAFYMMILTTIVVTRIGDDVNLGSWLWPSLRRKVIGTAPPHMAAFVFYVADSVAFGVWMARLVEFPALKARDYLFPPRRRVDSPVSSAAV